ncbi:MAG TPA: transglycosylase domain-containing protein [Pyrinomonadaceae bacterium]|nr:transglycosylase domain-containing protein [Pyrinomonadaceae bacterium]
MFRAIWKLIQMITLGVVAFIVFALIYELATFPRVEKLRDNNPETTALIETRIQEARARGEQPKRVQQWVPLERISVHLLRAVLAGEDSNFATHDGFDYDAIQKAWEQAQRDAAKEAKQQGEDESSWIPAMPSFKRGASTVSQQLSKNLYLSTERSFVRKAREAAITYFLEKHLSKRRILEIYLNVIEWGDGIYGAEAAAQSYFRKPAANLTAQEAAFLSAIIPNPRTEFNPQINPRRVARRQRIIARGMPHVKLPN